MNSSERFIELDIWRGVAILGMLILHAAFLLDYLGIQHVSYGQGGWHLLARCIQWSFLLLVGIGLQLSYQRSVVLKQSKAQYLFRNLKRGVFVSCCGLIVTLSTAILVPEEFVRFGVLHLIGFSILFLSFFADRPRFCLLLSLLVYLASFHVSTYDVHTEWLLIFGFSYPLRTLDYFPVFPWLALPALGIFIGSLLYKSSQRAFSISEQLLQSPISALLAFVGKHSLLIYMAHVPLLVGIFRLLYG